MVSWDIDCRPTKAGGLGIMNAQTMVDTFKKWVSKIMSQQEDIVMEVLKNDHGWVLNWESHAAPV